MKKIIFTLFSLFTLFASHAQVTDTVSLGAGYANQVWYSLPNDEQGSSPKNNWDLAFAISGFSSSIHINSANGINLWVYPNGDITAWATVDTTGLSTWAKLYNTDTSWAWGAFDVNANPADPFDMGWGIYNMATHVVNGDSLYIIKLANSEYKKLSIESLANGAYTFRFANLNGTGDSTVTITKTDYAGKNFAYYSIQNLNALNREPATDDWDILFTQYTTFIPAAYTVTGVLHNDGVSVAQADAVANAATYTNWGAHTFNAEINELGYDWKSFNGAGYDTKDSLVYFVMQKNGTIWKMIFTGFTGSGTGSFMFSKEMLAAPTAATDIKNNNLTNVALYPNPATGNEVSVIFKSAKQNANATIIAYDLTGKICYTEKVNTTNGLQVHKIDVSSFKTGMYVVMVDIEGSKKTQKLVINH